MSLGFKNLFSGFGKQQETGPTKVVGVDFGSSSVKVLELHREGDLIKLGTYGELQLGPYADDELGKSVMLPSEKKIEALVDVLRESKVGAKHGLFALPLSSSFVTVFSLIAKEGEDLDPRVRVEARKYIPVPMSDVSFEWTELPALGERPEDVHEVLAVAVQNEARGELDTLKNAVAMSEQPSEIELFSSMRALRKKDDTSIAIIDLGAKTSKLYIAHDGMVRRIHRVFAGGAAATQKIATELSVSFEEAENQKRNYTDTDPNAVAIKKAVVTSFERPFQEFKRVLEQYESKTGATVDRVVVTGGSASFSDMQTYASYMLDRPVDRANAFTKIAYPAFMEDVLVEIAPTFSVALGAALRSFQQ